LNFIVLTYPTKGEAKLTKFFIFIEKLTTHCKSADPIFYKSEKMTYCDYITTISGEELDHEFT